MKEEALQNLKEAIKACKQAGIDSRTLRYIFEDAINRASLQFVSGEQFKKWRQEGRSAFEESVKRRKHEAANSQPLDDRTIIE